MWLTSQVFFYFSVQYTLPSILPKELSEDQVLTMLQALIMSVEQEERFCPDEILNLKKMLKSKMFLCHRTNNHVKN